MVRVALAQVNVTVGDLDGNVERLVEVAAKATAEGADVACFPELALTGYPPEDLVLRPEFVQENLEALAALADETRYGCAVLTGFVDETLAGRHNAAALVHGGGVIKRYHKIQLPNYGVFDERRTFTPGTEPCPVRIAHAPFGLSICEDAWHEDADPFSTYAELGARVIVNINGSPYHRGKLDERIEICRARAKQTGAWIVYVNLVGGQDELVFDGGSMVIDPEGEVAWRAARFDEDLLIVDLDVPEAPATFPGSGTPSIDKRGLAEPPLAAWPESDAAEVYAALTTGVRDYVNKNGFAEAVIGLSGGIDSALVATIAADALGAPAVRVLAMPSRYSSPESLEDAADLAARLGIRLDVIGIDSIFTDYLDTLEPLLAGTEPGITQENLQARIRGNLLMALSNTYGSLVLATGNKSEYAVGYATLYGDMAGGYAPIKDVPKTLVYELCRWRNDQDAPPPIPERVLTKPPSAELRPDQKDTDSLPPYDELDPVIEAYVEDDRSPDEIILEGYDPALVERIAEMIDHAEYKRRQAPPGVKITPKAFGRDRRLPITNRFGTSRG